MVYIATDRELPLRRGVLASRGLAFVLGAFALASFTAAWVVDDATPSASISDADAPARVHSNVASKSGSALFDNRFFMGARPQAFAADFASRFRFRTALDSQASLQDVSGALRPSEVAQPTSAESQSPAQTATLVPLPRARPLEADLALANADVAAVKPTQTDDRNLFQKLSDLVPGHLTLASLTPNSGLLGDKPDLGALGYDNTTAVYDITARVVYLPNGSKLEAHSGFGNLRDDPAHVNQRNVGATPPAVYDLKPREKIFHGVQALRMIPVDGETTFGRAGLLTHSYMLGPNGDSNGCVSIRDYDRFLAAFQNGEIKRLVVVTSLSEASRRSPMKS
jgi:Protein of unknown function (DUF2778)